MPLNVQDFLRGIDFTVLLTGSQANHNNLVDLTTPFSDGSVNGKGIILRTKDTALDTPDVPDPGTAPEFAKWERYLWLRIPHATATSRKSTVYAWNDDIAVSDPVYLRWLDTGVDLTAILASIASVSANANTALVTANNAITTANSANTVANTASVNSTAAVNTANGADANATNALTVANQATADAVSASTAAATALAAANAKKDLVNAINPGLSFQVARTNAAATATEWAYYGIVQTVVKQLLGSDSTTGSAIPIDNTIPQITEGKEYVSISITPKSASSLIRVRFSCFMDGTAGKALALFQDAILDALMAVNVGGSTITSPATLEYVCSATSTTLRTYRIRFGPSAGGDTAYMNRSSGSALFGVTAMSFLVVEELSGTLS